MSLEEDFRSKLKLIKNKKRDTNHEPTAFVEPPTDDLSKIKDDTSIADKPRVALDLVTNPSISKTISSATTRASTFTVRWTCQECQNECLPITFESRCLCGHRMKEHDNTNSKLPCKNPKCKCIGFVFVVAEGAWILRCQCKHKHIEHDCSTTSHPCMKCSAHACRSFLSPWVCNCGHVWGSHQQAIISQESIRGVDRTKIIHSMRQDGLGD